MHPAPESLRQLLLAIVAVAVAVTLSGCAANPPIPAARGVDAKANPGPVVLSLAVMDAARQAERDGAALYAAQQASRPPAITVDQLKDATDRVAGLPGTRSCGYTYNVVEASLDSGPVLFFIARPQAGMLVFGPHYRVQGARATPSTKGCFALPVTGSATEVAAVTHLLSPTPSEFHVYLSLASGHAMVVATSTGLWSVEQGRVRYAGSLG